MAETITEWQRKGFADGVIYSLGQQKNLVYPDLDPMNIHTGFRGDLDSFNIMGHMIEHDITERAGDTVVGNAEHGRVWCKPFPSDATLYLTREDEKRSAVSDPNSSHVRVIAETLMRAKDKRIINAATAAVLFGELGTSSFAFDTTNQQIALGSSPNNTLTKDKIELTSFKLDAAGVVDDEGQRYFYYAPGQKRAVMGITQAASADFTAQRIYDSGTINGKYWMGFTWRQIPDVVSQNADMTRTTLKRMLNLSGTTRSCLAIGKGALGYTEVQNFETFLDILPDKQHVWQARAVQDMNAARILQNGVVEILALEQTT